MGKRSVKPQKAKVAAKRTATSGKTLLSSLLKKFGEGVVWSFAENQPEQKIDVIPCPTKSVNWLFGRGGLPRGRLTELAGHESSGKTTLANHFMRAVQLAGGSIALVDMENSMDLDYLRQCGVDEKKNFIFAQPDYAEQALDLVEELITAGQTDLIVLDSVAAMTPKAELEGDMTDVQVGLQARVLSKAMRRINVLLKGTNVAVVFTNQVRDKIGGFGWGPQTMTPGGRALKHTAAVRLELKRTKPIKVSTKQIGFLTKIKCVKNKVAPPFREIEVPIMFGYGFDERLDYIDLATKAKAIKKMASIFYFGKNAIGNGWRESYEKIQTREKLKAAIDTKIDAMLVKWSDLGSAQDSHGEANEEAAADGGAQSE